jgi:hypothetical protein
MQIANVLTVSSGKLEDNMRKLFIKSFLLSNSYLFMFEVWVLPGMHFYKLRWLNICIHQSTYCKKIFFRILGWEALIFQKIISISQICWSNPFLASPCRTYFGIVIQWQHSFICFTWLTFILLIEDFLQMEITL